MNGDPGSRDLATIERRQFLRRAAVVAWSTPVILTVLSESAFAQCAGSGVECCAACSPVGAVGTECTTGITTACCSGLVCKKSQGPSNQSGKRCACS